jgi:hypothetical protein
MHMTTVPGFEAYLSSKRIDSAAFRSAEPELWESWKNEFEQMHPNSFTVQKLNLINPVRRKYQLPLTAIITPETDPTQTAPPPGVPSPRPGKPVMKPRPKPE